MANAIAPLLSGKKHAASRDTEQSGSAREEHLLEVIRSLKDTIKELRTALQAANTDQTATSAREVAAEKDIRSSYKAALLKKTPGKSHLVVKDIPDLGDPLQPTGLAVKALKGKHTFTAVQGKRLYKGDNKSQLDMKHIGPSKAVSDWKVSADTEGAFAHVLLVGQQVAEAHFIATQAMSQHACVCSVSAHVLATGSKRNDASVHGILTALGRSRDSLTISGMTLSVKVITQRMEWETKKDADVKMTPPEHSLLLCWERSGEGTEDADHEPVDLPQDKAAIRVVCCLDPTILQVTGEDNAKMKAARWAEEKCWELTSPYLTPTLTHPPPMQVGKRGSKYEVTMVLPAPMVKQVLCNSGKVTGAEYRLFMNKDTDVDTLKANMVWVKLPQNTNKAISDHWKILHKQPWFAGLIARDRADRLVAEGQHRCCEKLLWPQAKQLHMGGHALG